MIDAQAIRHALALQAIEPFDRLTASELVLVSCHMRHRRFDPGAQLLAAGTAGEIMFVTIEGGALAGTDRAEAVFDASSVLFGLPSRSDYRAGPEGLGVLCLAKTHLSTIARECPDFIVGLASLGARRRG